MQQAIQLKTTIPPGRNSSNRSPWRDGLFLIALTLALFGLSQTAQAVTPAPDGGYPGGNTAEGDFALESLTTGTFNTALGDVALFSNTDGFQNTATGAGALFSNTLGTRNTAHGLAALGSNTEANDNTAVGWGALFSNTTDGNTAVGSQALLNNTIGAFNTATGYQALLSNVGGKNNTAYGAGALINNTGTGNIALGANAGLHLTTGFDNIDIGNPGAVADDSTIRIGSGAAATFISGIFGVPIAGTPVVVVSNGRLGVAPSSQRFKDEIKPMEKASAAILSLKPVTFRYKEKIDPKRTPQFGLVAEDVAKVNPDLVARDAKGDIYTVRYEAVNAMLLNEFLKEHQKVQKLEAALKTVNERLKEQDAKIDKVNAKVEMSRPVPQTVVDNH